jgi:hypothetical protein
MRFIGNCNYSLKSMLVDMGAAMFFFLYEVAYILVEIINIWYLINWFQKRKLIDLLFSKY